MTPRESREDAALNRKQQIIEAAIRLFSSQGFYKTTTAHVAQAVGVTQPYVFHFFKSKEELYLAVLEKAFDRIRAAFAQAEAPPDQVYEAMGRGFHQLLTTHREETLMVMQSYTISEAPIRERVREMNQLVYETVLARLQQAGYANAPFLASMFFGSGLVITMSEVLGLPHLNPFYKADC